MSEMEPFGGVLARRESRAVGRELALLGWGDGSGAVGPRDDEPIELGSMRWLSDPVAIEVAVYVVQGPDGGRAA